MIKTRLLLPIAITIALGFPCQFARTAGQNGVSVQLLLVDTTGNTLTSEAQVEDFTALEQAQHFRATDPGKDYSTKFNHNMADGPYHLKVRTTGFWSAERFVQVNHTDTWVVVALQVGMDVTEGGLPAYEVRGRIEDAPYGAEPTFVRLSGVFSDLVADDKARPDGEFDFGLIAPGLYTLTATQAGKVIALKAVEVSSGMSALLLHVGAKP
jgi:hypothetical protein